MQFFVVSSIECPSEADSVTGQSRNQYHTGSGILYLADSRGELTVGCTRRDNANALVLLI